MINLIINFKKKYQNWDKRIIYLKNNLNNLNNSLQD